ncbi:MAG: hypothetical protein KKC71_01570 [Chloroflexi bacterium]|nr:hypothetical protein [Chloroflexota bacterium]
MARRKQSRGKCAYCGEEMAKAGISKHLPICPRRLEVIQAAAQKEVETENLWHLRVKAAYSSAFWLDLEMRGTATLEKLDKYLRAIWLECCGHLSQFTIGGWGGRQVGKARTADHKTPHRADGAQHSARGDVYRVRSTGRLVMCRMSL